MGGVDVSAVVGNRQMSVNHHRVYTRSTLYLTLLAATPLVEVLAGSTLLVTYILYGYRFLLLLLALRVAPRSMNFWRPARQHLVLPIAYVLFFWISTYYGADLEYSIRHRAYFLPVLVIDFFLWYVAGRMFDESFFIVRLYWMTAVFSALSIAFALTGVIDAEATRVIYGPDVPVALAAAVICSKWVIALILFFSILASLKKTVVLCGLIGVSCVIGLKWIYGTPGWGRDRVTPRKLMLSGVVFLVVLIPLVEFSWSFVQVTVGRLLLEREDLYRLAMLEEFLRLLGEYFPYGSGYYTFGSLTRETLPYTTFTADGSELSDGMSLHNTGMHVLLEGGLVVTIVLLLMYLSVFRCVIRLIRNHPSRGLGILLFSWLLVCIAYGMLNQLHATRYYFGIIGYAIGCHWRYFPKKSSLLTPQQNGRAIT